MDCDVLLRLRVGWCCRVEVHPCALCADLMLVMLQRAKQGATSAVLLVAMQCRGVVMCKA